MPTLAFEISRILATIYISLVSIWAINLAYLAVTIRPRFEKLFKDYSPTFSSAVLYGSKRGRFFEYIELINSYEHQKEHNTAEYRCYDGYNFPEHVSKFEFLAVKINFLLMKMTMGFFAVAIGIPSYYYEQHQSDLMHKLLFVLFPTTLISGAITLISCLYLKKRILPRFQKMIEEKSLPNQGKIFFAGYLALLSNYSYQQKHNTTVYRLIKPYDFLSHVSRLEIFLGKIARRGSIVFFASSFATLIWLCIRIQSM